MNMLATVNPTNLFKAALEARKTQLGLWLGLANPFTAEICACAGWDWLVIDGEHSPNDLQSVLLQTQVIGMYPRVTPVARVPFGHGDPGTALIKQYLDLGVQTLLVPMVDTAEQARSLVRACRYPPDGVRGMGGSRASRWGAIADYARHANKGICLLVQVETPEGLKNVADIAVTDGVDGVFIGPTDLSAALGHVGNPAHPEVQHAIAGAFTAVTKAGKPAGILTPDEASARRYLEMGFTFVAVGQDASLLQKASSNLLAKFRGAPEVAPGKTY
jgi:4-hydroxy-2-oxoheptanedioate aldolase